MSFKIATPTKKIIIMGAVYTALLFLVILFGGGHSVPGILSMPEDLRGIEVLMPVFSMSILLLIVRRMKLPDYEVDWMIMFIAESFAVGATLAILREDAPLTFGAFLILCVISGIFSFTIIILQDSRFPLGIGYDDLHVVFLVATTVAIGSGIAYTVFYNALVGLATMIAIYVLPAVVFGIFYPISYIPNRNGDRKDQKSEEARKEMELLREARALAEEDGEEE